MTKQKQFGEGFSSLADTSHLKSLLFTNTQNNKTWSLENVPGKQASVKILFAIATDNDNAINKQAAAMGLALFGEYTDEERQTPDSHPNIKFLIDVIDYNENWEMTVS